MNADCFGFHDKRTGSALSETICAKSDCPFYKTLAQYNADAEKYLPVDKRLKANRRLKE